MSKNIKKTSVNLHDQLIKVWNQLSISTIKLQKNKVKSKKFKDEFVSKVCKR